MRPATPPLNPYGRSVTVKISGNGGLTHVRRLLKDALRAATHAKRGEALDEATRIINRWAKKK